MINAIVFDVESYPIDGAADYIEPATAPSNYVKPDAIAAYVEKANAEQLAKAALDVDLARIVALGYTVTDVPISAVARNEDEERAMLVAFWQRVTAQPRPTLIGFNCVNFDLPLMLRRSLYLDVPAPNLVLGKYRHPGVEDLMLSLSYDGALKYRSLAFYTRRFNLDVQVDPTSGADIGRLVAAGDWDAVAAHVRCDVTATQALARRMGVL